MAIRHSGRVLGAAAVITLLGACGSNGGDRATTTSAVIWDQLHGEGVPGFFWLPPIAPVTTYGSTFKDGLDPIVTVEALPLGSQPAVATFTTSSGSGGATVRSDHLSQYSVNWDTRGAALDPATTYRVRVFVDGFELGFADVDVTASRADLRNVQTGEFVPLLAGTTLRIRFRIEPAAVRCSEVVCGASDQCHVAGTCDPRTATCSNPAAPDGTGCDDGSARTRDDACQAGVCKGTPWYEVGGTIFGLTGTGLVLRNNGGDDLLVAASGAFAFATKVTDGTPYSVTVAHQPENPAQVCEVVNDTGTVLAADVTGVWVSCRSVWSSIATSGGDSFGIRPDGTLWAWGDNRGRLGNGTYFAQNVPVQIGQDFASVSAGESATAAVKTDGTLWAWGDNSSGQLGDGSTTPRLLPAQIGTGYASVAASGAHTLAVKTDGTLWAWGDNSSGQLGDGTTTARTLPVQIGTGYASAAPGGNVYSALYGYTLAVKVDGTLWGWGNNFSGQLGDGTTTAQTLPVQIGTGFASVAGALGSTLALKTDGTLWAWGGGGRRALTPVQVGTGFASVVANDSQNLALKTDGTVWAWPSGDQEVPVQVGADFASVALGWAALSVAVKTDGTLWAWGKYAGYARPEYADAPVQIDAGYTSVAAGGVFLDYSRQTNHAVALKTDGTLWAWGSNECGKLGDGTTTSGLALPDRYIYPPVQTIGDGFASVAAGGYHTVALKTDGTLWAWGCAPFTTGEHLVPEQIGAGFTSVAAGDSSTAAIKADGTLWKWYGDQPVQIGTDFASVATFGPRTYGVKADGTLWAWGENYDFDPTFGCTTADPNAPPVPIGTGFASVATAGRPRYSPGRCAFWHTVAVKTDGTLWAWGYDDYPGGGGLLGAATLWFAVPAPLPW